MSKIPENLSFTRTHEWVRRDGDTVVVGITEHAQDLLGEVVYVELPEAASSFDGGDELGTLESVKAVAEFFAPVSGEVSEVNERLESEPNLVNDDPYGDGWLVKISASAEAELMDAESYSAFLEEESH